MKPLTIKTYGMKFLFIVLLLPFLSIGQKLALLDRSFQQPIKITDTFTMEQASMGALAVYFNDMPSIISTMQSLIKNINEGAIKEGALDVPMGSSLCVVRTRKIGRVSMHNIVLTTKVNGLRTVFTIANQETHKKTLQRLTMFLDYLRNNASVMEK